MSTQLTTVPATAIAMAQEFGYAGEITVGALEDLVRRHQKLSAEALLEMGKHLMLLKEITPHGEFLKRVELLNIPTRVAQRVMQVTMKSLKSGFFPHLIKNAGNQSKILELALLDDDVIDALQEDGLSVLNDEIEGLTATQLKERIRQLNASVKSNEAQLETELDEARAQIKQLKKQVAVPSASPVPLDVMAIRQEIAAADFVARSQIDAIIAQTAVMGSDIADWQSNIGQNAWLALMGISELARAQADFLAEVQPDVRVSNLTNTNGLTEVEKQAVKEKLEQTLTSLRVDAQDRRYALDAAKEARRLEEEGPRRGRPKGTGSIVKPNKAGK